MSKFDKKCISMLPPRLRQLWGRSKLEKVINIDSNVLPPLSFSRRDKHSSWWGHSDIALVSWLTGRAPHIIVTYENPQIFYLFYQQCCRQSFSSANLHFSSSWRSHFCRRYLNTGLIIHYLWFVLMLTKKKTEVSARNYSSSSQKAIK